MLALLFCRLQMTEATLALSDQKAQDLGELLATAEQKHRLGQQVGTGLQADRQAGGVWDSRVTGCGHLRMLQNGSLSSSGTCQPPMKRTCCFETR